MTVARVGTGVTGAASPGASSIAASSKNVTSGNGLLVFVKWEATTAYLLSVTDSVGNVYTIDQQAAHPTGGEPHAAIAYSCGVTGNAALVVTANFTDATASSRRIIVEEFSGLGGPRESGSINTGTAGGGGGSYSTANIAVTAGVMFAGVGDFNTLTTPAAGGTPTATIGANLTDTFVEYLISTGAQTVTPGASVASGQTRWLFLTVSLPQLPEINATVGGWTWAGTQSPITRGPETAFQQDAFQSNAFQIFGGAVGGGGVTTINAGVGAWNWAGSQATTTQLINAGVGAWNWAGSTASTTQLINAGVGAWTWAGTTATTTQLINAGVGAWTWAGISVSFAGATEVNATPGAWNWAGSTAEIPTQIPATPGAWNWAGAQASTTQLINAGIGAFSWAGSTASFSQLINSTPGLWDWAGTTAEIVSLVVVDAIPGLWDWTGSQASISDTSTPAARIFAGNRRNYIIKDKKYYNLTNEELCILIARELVDFTREDIRVSYKNKKPHLISKEYFATLQDTLKALEISDVKPVFNDDDDDAFMVLI